MGFYEPTACDPNYKNTKHKKAIRRPRRVREAETIFLLFPALPSLSHDFPSFLIFLNVPPELIIWILCFDKVFKSKFKFFLLETEIKALLIFLIKFLLIPT